MENATAVADHPVESHGHGHNHDHAHDHPAHLAHHFDSLGQQFDASKLGMWIFLVTEVLFFSGLFCAYSVYRSNHPEIFIYGHHYLDRTLGAVNTVVLLFSSLTMAWAVRCSQLRQGAGLKLCLALTIACAFGFLGIKYVEYKHKWEDGLLWGAKFNPIEHGEHAESPGAGAGSHGTTAAASPASTAGTNDSHAEAGHAQTTSENSPTLTNSATAHAEGTTPAAADLNGSAHEATAAAGHPTGPRPEHVSIFFSIYFCMTGLHAIHIIIGIGLISWLLIRAFRGEFVDGYYTPVDLIGLYWHVVDLVWIYLFPLLYLIH
jgi:cytochrome c oxidase subunit 3